MPDGRPKLRNLPPSEAWEDAFRRSIAAGIAGWLLAGILQVFCEFSRPTLVQGSAMLASFLASLAFAIFYYHRRSRSGTLAAVIAAVLPFGVNFLWAKATPWFLWYPVAFTFLGGCAALWVIHRKASGPRWQEDPEFQAIEAAMADFEAQGLSWFDRFVAFWVLGVIVLLVLRLVR